MRPDERNPPAVRRPGGKVFVELRIGGQRFEAIRIDIEQVQVPRASRAQISFLILLEMQRIDHDRLGGAAGFARSIVSTRRLPSGDQAYSPMSPVMPIS